MAFDSVRKATRVHRLHSPKAYNFSCAAVWAFTFGGFTPAIVAWARTGLWWLNSAMQSPEWANPHSSAMRQHVALSVLWLFVVVFQFNVSVGYMFPPRQPSEGGEAPRRHVAQTVRMMHQAIGYVGFAICWAMVLNAHAVTHRHGVAGKLWMNGLATVVGAGMLYHMTSAVLAIRRRDVGGHLWHVAGGIVWIAFPGMGRTVGLLVQTLWLGRGCDFLYTNGWLTPILVLQIALLWALRWSMLGKPFRWKDYTVFLVLMVVDFLFAYADDSFLRCPEEPMMAQVPGRPWVLQKSAKVPRYLQLVDAWLDPKKRVG